MITLSKAKKAIEASENKARELGVEISTTIVDHYGVVIAFSRMDDAIKISPKFSYAKAYTSGTLGMNTADMAIYATEGKPYYDMNSLFGGELTTIAGGLVVKKGDKIVGGIGVGGSQDVNQDVACALEALKVIDSE